METDERPIRLRAFVGRSFLPEDEATWFEFRKIFDSLRPIGFVWEDAKESQPRPISAKVRQVIEKNDVSIDLLTRRFLLRLPHRLSLKARPRERKENDLRSTE